MQNRIRKIANFFAFNILFFALYLNFIDKDKTVAPREEQQRTAAFGATPVGNQFQKPVTTLTAAIK